MTVEADKAMRGIKNIRRRFDELWMESGKKRPTTYAKMRDFVDGLILIVNEETVNAGFRQSIMPNLQSPPKNKGKVKDRDEDE